MLEDSIYKALVHNGNEVFKRLERLSKTAQEVNDHILMGVIEKNKHTQFGRNHHFSEIESIGNFKENVGLGDYSNHIPYIEKMTDGATNQLTDEEPLLFAMTSGTVGVAKTIPISEGILLNYRDYVGMMTFSILEQSLGGSWQDGKMINLVSTKGVTTLPGGLPYGSLSSFISAQQTEAAQQMYTTPFEVASENSKFDFMYCTALFALLERNVTVIRAAFMTSVHDFCDYLFKNYQMLIEDIRCGTIHESVELSDDMRRKLLKRLNPSDERANELATIFAKGNLEGVLKEIWPNLAGISAIGSSSFTTYAERVKFWSGDIPQHHCVYCASEGVFAAAITCDSDEYVLLPDTVYYEFLPVESHSEKTLSLSELEVGKSYEVIVTNTAGLYRYKIGDVVEVVRYFNELPVIKFSHRSGQMMNLVGEKTNIKQVSWAMGKLAEEFEFNIIDFALLADIRDDKKRYVIFLELDDLSSNDKVLVLEERIQHLLGIANKSLGVKFRTGAIDGVELNLLKLGTNARYREFVNAEEGNSGQTKPVKVINSPEREKFFRDHAL